MKTLTTVEKTIIKILAHILHKPLHYILPRKQFYTELPMDATEYLLTLVEIEQRFQVDIPDRVAFGFRNAREIANYLSGRKAA